MAQWNSKYILQWVTNSACQSVMLVSPFSEQVSLICFKFGRGLAFGNRMADTSLWVQLVFINSWIQPSIYTPDICPYKTVSSIDMQSNRHIQSPKRKPVLSILFCLSFSSLMLVIFPPRQSSGFPNELCLELDLVWMEFWFMDTMGFPTSFHNSVI